eukprot:11175403-Lingulodinium_polyedra.AAC.1
MDGIAQERLQPPLLRSAAGALRGARGDLGCGEMQEVSATRRGLRAALVGRCAIPLVCRFRVCPRQYEGQEQHGAGLA